MLNPKFGNKFWKISYTERHRSFTEFHSVKINGNSVFPCVFPACAALSDCVRQAGASADRSVLLCVTKN